MARGPRRRRAGPISLPTQRPPTGKSVVSVVAPKVEEEPVVEELEEGEEIEGGEVPEAGEGEESTASGDDSGETEGSG